MNIRLDLKPLERQNLTFIRAWRNDYAIWRWTRQNDMLNEVEHANWFENQATDPTMRMYGIEVTRDGHAELVGVCGLTSIDHRNSRAEFSLYVAPRHQHQGYGSKALALLLAHGFANHGLNLIWGETFDGNPAAKVFERLGMTKEGTRREFYWKDGKRVDAHLYSLTRTDWKTSQTPSPPAQTAPLSVLPSSPA